MKEMLIENMEAVVRIHWNPNNPPGPWTANRIDPSEQLKGTVLSGLCSSQGMGVKKQLHCGMVPSKLPAFLNQPLSKDTANPKVHWTTFPLQSSTSLVPQRASSSLKHKKITKNNQKIHPGKQALQVNFEVFSACAVQRWSSCIFRHARIQKWAGNPRNNLD